MVIFGIDSKIKSFFFKLLMTVNSSFEITSLTMVPGTLK